MPFEQAFRLSAILLAATAFAGLLFARSVPAWLALLTAAVLTVVFLRTIGWTVRLPVSPVVCASPVLWNSLLIGAFLLFLLDLTLVSQDLLGAGIHFLVMLLVVKLVTLDQRRDYRHLYAICLMCILASASLTSDLWYVPIFLVYLLTAVWTLLLYHLTREMPRGRDGTVPPPPDPTAPARITNRFFWLTNGIAVLTFAMTLAIFFVIPRVSVGMLQKSRGEGLKTTGFSERVDLGMIGSVKEDPQIVMRVELPEQPAAGPNRLYLRGLAYDHYNGRSWSTSSRSRRNLPLLADGVFTLQLGPNRTPPNSSAPLRQDILLEALDTSVLFAVPFVESLSGEFVGIQTDGMSGLHLPFPPATRIRYSVTSRERVIAPEDQAAATVDYPGSIRDYYLRLPPLTPRVTELARRVVGQTGTPYEQTLAIHQHLLTNYRYSLEMDDAASTSPIEDFLFTRKSGYCEHYATAMVVMLRSLGIPARLVTGFLATEWNEFGAYFTVRQRDAHAWVEVYFPHSGWITMDPTPASVAVPSFSAWQAFQRIGESLRLHWDRVFIRYSAHDQLAVVYNLRGSTDSARDLFHSALQSAQASVALMLREFEAHTDAANPVLLWIFIGLAGGALAALIVVVSRRWPYPIALDRPSARTQQRVVHVYKKMLSIAARHGITVGPSTTPMEFVKRVNREWADAGSIAADLTALYCRGRFGGSQLSREEMASAMEQIAALQHLPGPIR